MGSGRGLPLSGGDLPGTVGILRPVLARIVLDRAAQAGATVLLATSCAGLRQDTDGVDVTFTDGSAGRYDLVVAAGGVRSPSRTRRTAAPCSRAKRSRPCSASPPPITALGTTSARA